MTDKVKLKTILKGKKSAKFKEFLDYYKQFVGFSDWNIIFGIGEFEDSILAEVDVNLLEKIITIGVCKKFFNLESDRQKNILFHELLHGRVLLFKKRYEDYKETEEEYMVNDLVRGFESTEILKFKGDKK